MTEVFIENKRIDVSEEFSSLITYAIDDIKDFGARNSSFSKTIIFPGTANNNIQFGSLFDVKTSNSYDATINNVGINFNAAVSAKCLVFYSGLQVMKGTIRLMEIVVNNGVPEYETSIVGELGGLVAAIGAKKLDELDFSAYDHVFNVSGITGSWDTITGSGVYYPLVDVGGVSVNKLDYDVLAFRPALYVKQYIDKIFDAADYTYTCDLFDTARFKSLVVPYNQKLLRTLTSQLAYGSRVNTRYKVVDNSSPTTANLKFISFTGAGWSANVDKDEFTYTDPTTITVTLDFSIYGDYVIAGFNTVTLKVRKNGTEIPGYSKILTNGTATYLWDHTFNLSVSQNDVITFYYEGVSSILNADAYATNATFFITSLVPIYAPATVGDPIEVNTTIPKNILQKDFLSSIIRLFNLYVYDDKLKSKHVNIDPYVDFYDLNVSGMTDWTHKLDRSKDVRLTPMSELNARYYDFKFKDDTDYYNELYKKTYGETFGSLIHDTAFQFVTDKQSVELIFASSPLVGYVGVDKIVVAPYKLNAGVEEKLDFTIRILQAKKITGVTSWSIKNGAAVLQSGLTTYGYAGNYDDPDAPANDIHFGVPRELYFTLLSGAINVNQFNVYWSSYMAEISDKDSQLLTAMFKLDAKDIYNLDFSKLVYVDGRYWRLNKIIDYNATRPDLTKVEMLKLINTVY